jgi:MFS family permease
MFGLALVVGRLVDRIGRPFALAGGLILISISCASLVWVESVAETAVALFGLGLGWSFSYVAATAQLSDATTPAERGRLLGFSDAMAAGLGAILALAGGYTLSTVGVAALGVGMAAIALAPVCWYMAGGHLRPARA